MIRSVNIYGTSESEHIGSRRYAFSFHLALELLGADRGKMFVLSIEAASLFLNASACADLVPVYFSIFRQTNTLFVILVFHTSTSVAGPFDN